MDKTLIFFDYDGVLADTASLVLAAAAEILPQLRLTAKLRREDLAALEQVSFAAIGEAAGVPHQLSSQFCRAVFAYLELHANSAPLFCGIDELLRRLSGSHVIAIVSGSPIAAILSRLEHAGLADTISHIADVTMPGSKSEKLRDILAREKARPEHAVFIGDGVSDIREGKRAGVRTIAAAWGWQPAKRLAAENPDHLVADVAELRLLLTRLIGLRQQSAATFADSRAAQLSRPARRGSE